MSPKKSETFLECLTDFIFGNKLPFTIVEYEFFKKLICYLRPAAEPYLPSRKTLSGKLLTETKERCINKDADNANEVTNEKWVCTVLQTVTGFSCYYAL